MKFIVISGAPNTGKTTAINLIADWLCNKYSISTDCYGSPLPSFSPNPSTAKYDDITIVLNLRGRKTIIHSATDDKLNMDVLIEKIKQNPDSEIVISSCRDIYWERDYFTKQISCFASFLLEFPLAKITRRNDFELATTWYKNSLLHIHQHILSNIPYNL